MYLSSIWHTASAPATALSLVWSEFALQLVARGVTRAADTVSGSAGSRIVDEIRFQIAARAVMIASGNTRTTLSTRLMSVNLSYLLRKK